MLLSQASEVYFQGELATAQEQLEEIQKGKTMNAGVEEFSARDLEAARAIINRKYMVQLIDRRRKDHNVWPKNLMAATPPSHRQFRSIQIRLGFSTPDFW